jgi:hypothetical protein
VVEGKRVKMIITLRITSEVVIRVLGLPARRKGGELRGVPQVFWEHKRWRGKPFQKTTHRERREHRARLEDHSQLLSDKAILCDLCDRFFGRTASRKTVQTPAAAWKGSLERLPYGASAYGFPGVIFMPKWELRKVCMVFMLPPDSSSEPAAAALMMAVDIDVPEKP